MKRFAGLVVAVALGVASLAPAADARTHATHKTSAPSVCNMRLLMVPLC